MNLALALHGGAGTLSRNQASPEAAKAYEDALRHALVSGWRLLTEGAAALDAVEAVVRILEDCPLFNAGRGSVLTHAGRIEMDAAVMCGKSLSAGAVSGVRGIANPVSLARRVMDKSGFVYLAGDGAGEFAAAEKLPTQPESWFITPERVRQLNAAMERGAVMLDHDKYGTVGAVALDEFGNLAAATSTGGITNKRYGRVGDSPIIGAGTYADNRACAISCTGFGEAFIRNVTAHNVASRIRWGGQSLREAAEAVVLGELPPLGGDGGLIAVNAAGEVVLPFNCEGMYRAWRTSRDTGGVAIF
jgi:beta-aspartyl-peptidase (threonine type)